MRNTFVIESRWWTVVNFNNVARVAKIPKISGNYYFNYYNSNVKDKMNASSSRYRFCFFLAVELKALIDEKIFGTIAHNFRRDVWRVKNVLPMKSIIDSILQVRKNRSDWVLRGEYVYVTKKFFYKICIWILIETELKIILAQNYTVYIIHTHACALYVYVHTHTYVIL